jgi:alkylated DNA repair dioxygenase AlkB
MEKTIKKQLSEKSFILTGNFSDVELIKNCISDVSDKLLKNPKIIVYGKECHQHRSIGFFSDTSSGYKYSGQIAKSIPLTENLKKLLEKINEIFSGNFNGILVNKYSGGEDYISPHSDDERALDKNAGVVSLSYGATRTFRIRNKKSKKIEIDIPTVNGILIQMGGIFQQEFTHEIPIQKKVQGDRYSFTFRNHIN